MRSSFRLGLAVFLLPVIGCGASGPRVVSVSGRVTLDRQPLAKAKVTFQPIAKPGEPNPGPGSYGETDADGRYSLRVIGDNRWGAVVGEHRVRISAYDRDYDPNDERTPPPPDRVAPRFNRQSTLTFPVPPEGSSEANFDVSSR